MLEAALFIEGTDKSAARPITFLRTGSKWHRHLGGAGRDVLQLWEVAVLSHLREAFRSGDIWLAHSRRYGDLKEALVPAEVARAVPKLAMPFEPELWLDDRNGVRALQMDMIETQPTAAQAGQANLIATLTKQFRCNGNFESLWFL